MAVTTLTASQVELYIDGIAVGCATSASLSINREYLDAVCAGTGIWKKSVAGNMDWSIDVDALWRVADALDEAANLTLRDLFTSMVAGTVVAVKFGVKNGLTPAVSYQFVGNAFINSLNPSNSIGDVPTWSATLLGDDALTLVNNA